MNDKDNNDILISLVGMNIKHPEKKLESHPDSEALAAFIDNPLPNKNATLKSLEEIKQHLNSCPDCYQQWFELKRQMLELHAVKQPWYIKLLSYKFGLTPFQFNIASGAVAASLVFVLVNQFVPTPQDVTFELPDKLTSLDKYCEQCSAEDYDTFINQLALKINEDCSNSNKALTKDVDQDINLLMDMHPEQDNTYLNKVLSKCKENKIAPEQK